MSDKPKRPWAPYGLSLPTWLVLGGFFLAPLLIMLVISFGQRGTYGGLKPIEDWGTYLASGAFLKSYATSLEPLYLQIAWRSIWMAVATTLLCLVVGYPIAYYVAVLAPARRKNLLLRARLAGFDRSLEEAATDLGAGPVDVFRRVTLPLNMPGIVAGALLAFTLSIDDYVITSFVAGVGATTLPLQIYSMLKVGVTPEVNAVSTLLLVVTVVLIALAQRLQQGPGSRGDQA